VIEGDLVLPQPTAVGGWDNSLQSGHAIAALLAHFVEQVPSLTPMLTTRCIVDLTRPVPMKPLGWRCDILREGKKLQQVRAVLLDGDTELVAMTALRARLAECAAGIVEHHYPGPEQGRVYDYWDGSNGFEVRMLGDFTAASGRATLWQRVTTDIVAGTPASPFVRSLALADFGSGMANAFEFRHWSFPNIDISVHLFRQPEGEWLLLDAETESAGNGLALTSGLLADRHGAYGRVHQTLFVTAKKS
jgi:hypothetical protein